VRASLAQRFGDFWRRTRRLHRAGVRLDSLLLLPLRRRLPKPCDRIDLKNGPSLSAPADSSLLFLFQEIWVEQRYAPGSLELRPGDTVVDLGAHVGVFTLWVASRYPQVRVLAVEPSPRAFDFLQANISCNRLRNVTAVPCACGGRGGQAAFYARGSSVGGTLYSPHPADNQPQPPAEVSVLGLDELFRRYQVERCALLKLDCEGAEYEILYSAAPAVLDRLQRVTLEYHTGLNQHTPEELAAYLEQHGFAVRSSPGTSPGCGYLHAKRSPWPQRESLKDRTE